MKKKLCWVIRKILLPGPWNTCHSVVGQPLSLGFRKYTWNCTCVFGQVELSHFVHRVNRIVVGWTHRWPSSDGVQPAHLWNSAKIAVSVPRTDIVLFLSHLIVLVGPWAGVLNKCSGTLVLFSNSRSGCLDLKAGALKSRWDILLYSLGAGSFPRYLTWPKGPLESIFLMKGFLPIERSRRW